MSQEIDLTDAVMKILNQYGSEVKKILDADIPKAAKAAQRKVAEDSPGRNGNGRSNDATGEYAKDWKSKVDENTRTGVSAVVFNKSHYQLTHLLEDGHVNWVKGTRYGSPKKPDAQFSHKISNGIRTDGLPGRPHPFMEPEPHIGQAAEWASEKLYNMVVEDLNKL